MILLRDTKVGMNGERDNNDSHSCKDALSYNGLQQITVKGIDMAFALPGATLSTSVSNASDARSAATRWARILRNGLDKAKTIGGG